MLAMRQNQKALEGPQRPVVSVMFEDSTTRPDLIFFKVELSDLGRAWRYRRGAICLAAITERGARGGRT
jgi:hypothetical protein